MTQEKKVLQAHVARDWYLDLLEEGRRLAFGADLHFWFRAILRNLSQRRVT